MRFLVAICRPIRRGRQNGTPSRKSQVRDNRPKKELCLKCAAVMDITWDQIFEARRAAIGVMAEEAAKAEEALRYVRKLIGGDVSALAPRLFELLLNEAPWTYRWVIWFVDCLTRFKDSEGYPDIERRLVHPKNFDEALSVLQVADRLDAAGLLIRFDISVVIDGIRKRPDLQLIDPMTGICCHCEVSVMFSADQDVEASQALEEMRLLLWNEDLSVAGILWMPEGDDELDGLIRRLQNEIRWVAREQKFRQISIPNGLLFGLAPKSQAQIVREWAQTHSLEPESFGVVPREVDQFNRLKTKIARKITQLPKGLPNILAIPAQTLFVSVSDPAELVSPVKEALSQFPMVAALVLSAVFLNPSGWRSVAYGDDLFACSERDGQGNQFLLILNPAATVPLPTEVIAKLHRAFSI